MLSGLRNRLKRHSSQENEDPFREDVDSRRKSRRPRNTAFRQQRLKSWQPILTPRTVLPLLFLLTVVCVPIGLAFIITTYNIQKVEVNYSKCDELAQSSYKNIPKKYYGVHFKSKKESSMQWKYDNNVCTIKFNITNDIKSSIYLYYKLTNFYQNHRKYVESYDWDQLRGEAVSKGALSSDCGKMRIRDNKIVYPCGLVANSLFNDTFSNLTGVSGTDDYKFSASGIAWKTDLGLYKRTKYNISDIVPPQNWYKAYPGGYTEGDLDALAKNERFMNWMRTAALPSFLKLYGINSKDILKKGTYEVQIQMNYPVTIFGGTKAFVLSTSSIIGGRNMGLGICYIIVGAIAIFFMLAFLVKHVFTKKRLNRAFLDDLGGEGLANASNGEQTARAIL